jgi:hypothetical protein
LRDPFENKALYLAGGGSINSNFEDDLQAVSVLESHLGPVRDQARLLSLSQGREKTDETGSEQLYLGPWARPRMWEQYGDNHAGVCFVFDRRTLLKTADESGLRHGAVNYTLAGWRESAAATPDLTGFDLANADAASAKYLAAHWDSIFLLKTDDYASEHEYRLISEPTPDGSDPGDVFLPIADALRFVVVGERFSRRSGRDRQSSVAERHRCSPHADHMERGAAVSGADLEPSLLRAARRREP